MIKFELNFSVQGYVKQTIKVVNDDYNAESIIKGLNDGTLLTTIHEPVGPLKIRDIIKTENDEVVANILSSDDELEYFDFEARQHVRTW